MRTTFAHFVYVCRAEALAQLHLVEPLSHLRSAADEQSNATYGASRRPWAYRKPSKKFINNLYYPYLCPSIPAPVTLLSPNPTSSQINRQGGH